MFFSHSYPFCPYVRPRLRHVSHPVYFLDRRPTDDRRLWLRKRNLHGVSLCFRYTYIYPSTQTPTPTLNLTPTPTPTLSPNPPPPHPTPRSVRTPSLSLPWAATPGVPRLPPGQRSERRWRQPVARGASWSGSDRPRHRSCTVRSRWLKTFEVLTALSSPYVRPRFLPYTSPDVLSLCRRRRVCGARALAQRSSDTQNRKHPATRCAGALLKRPLLTLRAADAGKKKKLWLARANA